MRCNYLISLLLLVSAWANGQQAGPKEVTTIFPTLNWVFKTKQPVFSSPLIDHTTVYFGGLDSVLYALDLQKGKTKWTFLTKGGIRSSPVIQGNQLVILSGDGMLYCLDKTNGKLLWSFTTGGEQAYPLYSYADYYHSSPVFDKEHIYFGSGDSCVYALDALTGKLQWRFKTGSVVHANPVLQNGFVFIGSFDGFFYALDATSGALMWKFKSVGQHYFPKGEMQGNPLFFSDKIYVGSRDYNFYALNAKEGYCHWNLRFPKGWAMGTPKIKDSILYVGTSDDMVLLALDPFSGQTKWKADVRFNVFGGPAFTDSSIYVGTLMGKLFEIQTTTGAIRWVFETEAYKRNKATYFTEQDTYRNDIQNIITKGEDFLTMYYQLGAIFSTPAINDQYLIVSSTDGNVYCFKRNDYPLK